MQGGSDIELWTGMVQLIVCQKSEFHNTSLDGRTGKTHFTFIMYWDIWSAKNGFAHARQQLTRMSILCTSMSIVCMHVNDVPATC